MWTRPMLKFKLLLHPYSCACSTSQHSVQCKPQEDASQNLVNPPGCQDCDAVHIHCYISSVDFEGPRKVMQKAYMRIAGGNAAWIIFCMYSYDWRALQ